MCMCVLFALLPSLPLLLPPPSGAQVQIHTYIRNVFAQWHKNDYKHCQTGRLLAKETRANIQSWEVVDSVMGTETMEFSSTSVLYIHIDAYMHLHTMHENEWKWKFVNTEQVRAKGT